MRLTTAARLLATLTLLGAPTIGRAQFVVYTDLPSFLAATSHAAVDGFDDLAPGVLATPLARSAGPFGYVASANTTDIYVTGSGADAWLSTNTSTDVITFSGFGPTVRGIGGFFFGTDFDGLFRAATTLTLRATDVAGMTTQQTLVAGTVGAFLGFVSTGDIASLTVETVLPPNDLAWPTVDDLVLAEGPSTVPEPSTAAILGTGLVGLALVARRRRGT